MQWTELACPASRATTVSCTGSHSTSRLLLSLTARSEPEGWKAILANKRGWENQFGTQRLRGKIPHLDIIPPLSEARALPSG